MLFIDYSSTFSIIASTKLISKLRTLALNTSFCNTSAMLTLKTVAPQGCVHSPLLYTLVSL